MDLTNIWLFESYQKNPYNEAEPSNKKDGADTAKAIRLASLEHIGSRAAHPKR